MEKQQALTGLLADLVAFRSVTGDHEQAAACFDYAQNYLRSRGMLVQRMQSNDFISLVATTNGTKKPKLMLQAHIDVITAPNNCYRLHENHGKLLGRGTYDMKFAAAIFLQIVDDLQTELSKYDFGIMFTSDEEIGGENGVGALLQAGFGADVCLLPDAGDDWHIETSSKGCWTGQICVSGTAAHGSRPWEGDNAIDRLLAVLQEIHKLFKEQHKNSDTFSVNMISGGKVMNQVADSAEATFDIRFLSEETCTRLHKQIKAITDTYNVSLRTIRHIAVCKNDINHELVVPFLRIAEELRGKPIQSIRSLGTSDAHYFTTQGTPVILMRPGGGGAHADNEWIDKEGLHLYYEAVKRYVQAIAVKT